jgi:Cof subfamily protein (haloacid dehalogenase superfamily)
MAHPPRISLVLSDVDGTLVTAKKVLTQRALAAVAALRSSGIRFAITSGRPPRGMGMLIEPLRIDTPIAGFNGGLFVRPDLSVLRQRTLPREIATETVALMREHELDPWVYTAEDWLITRSAGPHVERERTTVRFPPTLTSDLASALHKAVKIVGVSDDLEAVQGCEAAWVGAFGEKASATRSQPYYLDVTHRDANKGAVVDYLSDVLAIPRADIATIGDGPNDVLMFRRSGFSIAMGNAPEAVKAAANATTTTRDDEGFARAIERCVLLAGRAGPGGPP